MKKALFLTALIALLFSITAACAQGGMQPAAPQTPKLESPAPSSTPSAPPSDFQSFLNGLNAKRGEDLLWKREELDAFSALYQDGAESDALLMEEEIDALITRRAMADALTVEQALSDTDVCFRMLKASYAGYAYFGGDEAFEGAEREATRLVNERNGVMSAEELSALLIQAVEPIVDDGHFAIFDHVFTRESQKYMYYVPDLYFEENAADARYVKKTIAPDGALACCFAALSADGKDLPPSLSVNGEEVKLSWNMARNSPSGGAAVYEKTYADGLTVMRCSTLKRDESTAAQLDALMNAGVEYRALSAFIIDLCGNGGGNSAYGSAWIESYSGEYPQRKTMYAQNMSGLFLAYAAAPDSPYADSYTQFFEENRGRWVADAQSGRPIQNDGVIFVLADKKTVSSGETFLEELRLMQNAIVVGSNTFGSGMTGNIGTFYLPHAGIPVVFGAKAGFDGSLENKAGKGFMPDLWVNPADALERVISLIKHYGLIEP